VALDGISGAGRLDLQPPGKQASCFCVQQNPPVPRSPSNRLPEEGRESFSDENTCVSVVARAEKDSRPFPPSPDCDAQAIYRGLLETSGRSSRNNKSQAGDFSQRNNTGHLACSLAQKTHRDGFFAGNSFLKGPTTDI